MDKICPVAKATCLQEEPIYLPHSGKWSLQFNKGKINVATDSHQRGKKKKKKPQKGKRSCLRRWVLGLKTGVKRVVLPEGNKLREEYKRYMS